VSGFETLKTMDVVEMYRQTHISVAELRLILAKRFESFNRAKALGFFKILEREYNLDLSELVAEYEAFHGNKRENEEIFVVAKEEKGKTGAYLAVALVALAIALGWIFAKALGVWQNGASNNASPPAAVVSVPTQTPIVEAAKEVASSPRPNETLTPEIAPQIVAPTNQEALEASEAPSPSRFYVIPERDLWIGIRYLDTDQSEQKTISARYEFDPLREQQITFGHGRFRLIYGFETIEPKTDSSQIMRFKNGTIARVPTRTRETPPASAPSRSPTDANTTTPPNAAPRTPPTVNNAGATN
jgi:hypothetical protein